MSKVKRSRVWRTILPCLLMIAGIWVAVEEASFRSGAERTFATVREWRSEKLFGLRGTAKVDLEVKSTRSAFKNRSVRTHLWYRPSPGDRIPVYYGGGSFAVRVDSLWQRFLMPVILVLAAIAWFVEIWGKRGREGSAKAET